MSQENLISFLRNNFFFTNVDENIIFTREELLQTLLHDERQPDYSIEGDNANLNNNTEDYIDFRDYPLKLIGLKLKIMKKIIIIYLLIMVILEFLFFLL